MLNSYINSVPTPDLRKMWGYKDKADCELCGHDQCTLIHILACCPEALRQKRYTWRHDSVLKTIELTLRDHVNKMNVNVKDTHKKIVFVKSGDKVRSASQKDGGSLLDGAHDWKIQFDYENSNVIFPPVICPTSLRPDIVIWSCKSKVVIWAELTCPVEENISEAHNRKESKYADLKDQASHEGWTVYDFTVEAGARGCVSFRFNYFLRKIGISGKMAREALDKIAHTTARCSFAIFIGSKNKNWSHFTLIDGGNEEVAEAAIGIKLKSEAEQVTSKPYQNRSIKRTGVCIPPPRSYKVKEKTGFEQPGFKCILKDLGLFIIDEFTAYLLEEDIICAANEDSSE